VALGTPRLHGYGQALQAGIGLQAPTGQPFARLRISSTALKAKCAKRMLIQKDDKTTRRAQVRGREKLFRTVTPRLK
jgi:hypothetical protein